MKNKKEKEEILYNTDKGHSVNGHHFFCIGLKFWIFCLGKLFVRGHFIWPAKILQTAAIVSFPRQGPQGLKSQFPKLPTHFIHALARAPPSSFLPPGFPKGHSQSHLLYFSSEIRRPGLHITIKTEVLPSALYSDLEAAHHDERQHLS